MIIDKSWTLFLDRDGVINKEIKGEYVYQLEHFTFYEGALEAIATLTKMFHRLFIVTNQRGIGKGLYTLSDVELLHQYLFAEVEKVNGKIEKAYVAPDFDLDAIDRKPNIGMGLKAKQEYPAIDFSKSVMIGNNISDMKFGKALGMKTIYIESIVIEEIPNPLIDFSCPSLHAASILLSEYI